MTRFPLLSPRSTARHELNTGQTVPLRPVAPFPVSFLAVVLAAESSLGPNVSFGRVWEMNLDVRREVDELIDR